MDHAVNPIVKQPFHIGSGKMALLAIFAASKGKFFEINDLLFDLAGKKKQIDLRWLADKTGLKYDDLVRSLKDPSLRQKLSGDIRQGIELRLVGTPGFVIDDEVYVGRLPEKILEKYFN
jgi:protein-disulfide isomerase